MAIASSYAREPHELQELRRHRPAELQEIDLYVWHKRSVLGKGSFGTVYKGWSKRTFEGVAVKFVGHEVFANSPNGMDSLKREISIQRTLKDCVNILCLCHEEAISGGYVLIMELCDKDLVEYIRELKGLRETDTKDFLQQMAAGLKVMHEKGIAHRDLKPENILLKKDPVTNKMIVKLADFGFARSYLNDSARKVKMMMTTAAGTPLFMAPEVLQCFITQGSYARESYDEKVDLWSVGALLYNCLTGSPGFFCMVPSFEVMLQILKRKPDTAIALKSIGQTVTYIDHLPQEVDSRLSSHFKAGVEKLLRKLLIVDPTQRMNHDEFFSFVQQLTGSPVTAVYFQPAARSKRSSTTVADTDCYLRRYPGKADDPRLTANIEFYQNHRKSEPNGDYVDVIHRHWKGKYDRLRQHAGYIQWLFPIRERGTNKHAQELQTHEAKAICRDKQASARVLTSYKMMLDYYGMELKDPQSGNITRAKNWKERYEKLNRTVEDYLRITRMLKSLGELGYEHLKYPFVRFCIHEAYETGQLRGVATSCRNYWMHVIRDEGQRNELESVVSVLETK